MRPFPFHPIRLFQLYTGCLALAVFPGVVAAQQVEGHYAPSDVEAGSQLYAGQCASCHGQNGDAVSGIDLRRGEFRSALSDEDLRRVITEGVPDTGMPPFALRPEEQDALVAYIRAGLDDGGVAVRVGDAESGRRIFEGEGGCTSCHRVDGVGPRVAPDLSDVGARRTPAQLQRSLLDPTSQMMPINRPVTAVTRDGRTYRGRRLNEDSYTVQIIDEEERLVSLEKSELAEYERATTSPMPSVAGTLTTEQVADLVAYLLSLRVDR